MIRRPMSTAADELGLSVVIPCLNDAVRFAGCVSGGVEAMEMIDHFGQTTRLRFTNLVRNPRFEAGTFRFSPPKGADVLGE